LQTVMSKLLNEFLFDVPDKISTNARISINAEMVKSKLDGLDQEQGPERVHPLMKYFFFIFFFAPACWLFAQNSAEITVSPPNKYDSIRAIYIKSYPDHFFVWPVLKQRRLDYEISDLPQKNRRLLYKSNSPYSLGLGAYIFEVALELTAAVPLDEKSKEIYGPSDASDIQVTLFTKKWGLDLYRQKYSGFYIDDPSIKIPIILLIRNGQTSYPRTPE
jgi:hypothetical protein